MPPGNARDHGVSNFLVDPASPADLSPAVWSVNVNPGIVTIATNAAGCSPQLEAAIHARRIVNEAASEAGRHLVLADSHARHRLLLSPPEKAASHGYLIPVDDCLNIRLAALQSFHEEPGSRRAGAARAALRPSAYQRHRLSLLLTILDRLDPGLPRPATMRQLAEELVFPGQAFGRAIDWRTSSHRRQVQRLAAEARHMMLSGYCDLLTCISSSCRHKRGSAASSGSIAPACEPSLFREL